MLVYTVDSSIGTGSGPIQVMSVGASAPDLAGAPLAVGEQVTVAGVTIRVDAADGSGHRVTVTRG